MISPSHLSRYEGKRGFCETCAHTYDPALPNTYDAGYVTGAILGDGFLYRIKGLPAGIRLEVTDKAFADKFAFHVHACTGIRPWRGEKSAEYKANLDLGFVGGTIHRWIVTLAKREWCEKLTALKHGKEYSKIETMGLEFKAGFLQGLLDAEGYVNPRGRVDIANKDRGLLQIAARLFSDLQYPSEAKIYGPYSYSRGVMHLQIARTGLIKTKESA